MMTRIDPGTAFVYLGSSGDWILWRWKTAGSFTWSWIRLLRLHEVFVLLRDEETRWERKVLYVMTSDGPGCLSKDIIRFCLQI